MDFGLLKDPRWADINDGTTTSKSRIRIATKASEQAIK